MSFHLLLSLIFDMETIDLYNYISGIYLVLSHIYVVQISVLNEIHFEAVEKPFETEMWRLLFIPESHVPSIH